MTIDALLAELVELRNEVGGTVEIRLSIDEEGNQFKKIDGVFNTEDPETGEECFVIYPIG